jgi:hypothetical protein
MRCYLDDEYKELYSTLAKKTAELRREGLKLRRIDRDRGDTMMCPIEKRCVEVIRIQESIIQCRSELNVYDEMLRVLDDINQI